MKKATALVLILALMIIVGLGTTAILKAMISYSHMKIVNVERIKAWYLAEGYQYVANYQLRNEDTDNFTIKEEGVDIVVTKTENPEGSGNYEISVSVKWAGL